MSLMLELQKAIKGRFDSSPDGDAVRALITAIFPNNAPQTQQRPYTTFSFITSTVDFAMGNDPKQFENPLVQFSTWDDQSNSDRVVAAGGLLGDLFNGALLSVTGFGTIRADKISERLLEEPEVEKGFQHIVEVRYMLES